jgi:hypothetical protein
VADDLQAVAAAPATILLLALWLGLIAGFLHLGILVVRRWIDGDFSRLGSDFVWMIPAGAADAGGDPGGPVR